MGWMVACSRGGRKVEGQAARAVAISQPLANTEVAARTAPPPATKASGLIQRY